MIFFRTVKNYIKAVSNITYCERPLSVLIVCPLCVCCSERCLLYIFPGSGANYQGTRKVINQRPRPWCSYASDGHILEYLGGEGRGTLGGNQGPLSIKLWMFSSLYNDFETPFTCYDYSE